MADDNLPLCRPAPSGPDSPHISGTAACSCEDPIMTCLSQTAPLPRGGASLLHGLLALWQRHATAARTRYPLATLDDRALRDLGLTRDILEPPHRSDPARLWLDRIPG
ncbi:hypothetical protein B5U98_16130 [Bosea sp. Tri-39]|uniref:DUF1127 domain-containing protein n=1 Tax=Bosea sp. Tri-49 TaxID=1867715 RepID=UPI001026E22A|nr:hypothetical protein B5U98_16130 [Bosea sp. Tri-39]RXT32310.1 hypothetical protein B5U99_26975 [Bosea sp. Tri-54]